MAASFLSSAGEDVTLWTQYADSRKYQSRNNDRCLKVFVPFFLMMFAIVFAPESPQQLASICERHNPEIACRVW